MPKNKGKLTAYREIDTYELKARNLTLTGSATVGGNVTVTGVISGSDYQGLDTEAVLTIAASGSTLLSGSVYLTGSTPNIEASQSGQVIQFALGDDINLTSVTATRITGSTLLSGSDICGPSATITNLSGSQASFSGNIYVNGDISGSIVSDNLTAITVTGSSVVSGSNIYGAYGRVTNVEVANLTGSTIVGTSLVSGSSVQGQTGTIDAISAVTVVGSTSVSGSAIQGEGGIFTGDLKITGSANIELGNSSLLTTNLLIEESDANSFEIRNRADSDYKNLKLENLESSGAIYTDDIRSYGGTSVTIRHATTINGTLQVTGSISGSTVQGQTGTLDTINSAGTISGSTLQGQTGTIDNISGSEASFTGSVYINNEINLGLNPLKTSNLLLKEYDSTRLQLRDAGDSAYRQLLCGSVNCEHVTATGWLETHRIIEASGSAGITFTDNLHASGSDNTFTKFTGSSLTALTITGSTLVSGSDFRGPTATITTINGTNITAGTTVSGSNVQGQNATLDAVSSATLTASGTISGSTLESQSGTIDALSSVTVIGGTSVSGSAIQGQTGTLDALSSVTVIGSTSVSGSAVQGQNATLDNLSGSQASFSGDIYVNDSISGSKVFASGSYTSVNSYIGGDLRVTGSISGSSYLNVGSIDVGDHVTALTITGSTHVSGSIVYGATGNITNVYVTNLTGSGTVSGSTVIADTFTYSKKNRGYASGSSGVDIAHSLSAVPTTIQITASGSNPVVVSSALSGSAGFYVYHDAGGLAYFYWNAEV